MWVKDRLESAGLSGSLFVKPEALLGYEGDNVP